MSLLKRIYRAFVWLKRFRYRKGYGVHSPYAFNFITRVIYEKGCYYNYELFNNLLKTKHESDKVCKLLFRLTNYCQPSNLLYIKDTEDISDIFKWAKSDVEILDNLNNSSKIDFAYIAITKDIQLLRELLCQILPYLSQDSVLVVNGIGYSRLMQEFWRQLIQRSESGISFDLYDLGILFFDKDKNKQDYIVNF